MALAHGMLGVARMQISLAGTVEFIKAYQEHGPLRIAELWAFPAMDFDTRDRYRKAVEERALMPESELAAPDCRDGVFGFDAHTPESLGYAPVLYRVGTSPAT